MQKQQPTKPETTQARPKFKTKVVFLSKFGNSMTAEFQDGSKQIITPSLAFTSKYGQSGKAWVELAESMAGDNRLVTKVTIS